MAAVQDLSGKMFVFPKESNSSFVKLTPEQKSFTALTVCHRSFTDLKRDHSLFSLAVPSNANGFLTFVHYKNPSISVNVQGKEDDFHGISYANNKWHSLCTTWDSKTGRAQVWLNEEPLAIKQLSDKKLTGEPIVVLGQDQDNYGGKFDAKQSFVGMMTDVHVWDYVLSPWEIQKFMKDQNFTPGNVLNWAALDFEMKGKVMIENKQAICNCSY